MTIGVILFWVFIFIPGVCGIVGFMVYDSRQRQRQRMTVYCHCAPDRNTALTVAVHTNATYKALPQSNAIEVSEDGIHWFTVEQLTREVQR